MWVSQIDPHDSPVVDVVDVLECDWNEVCKEVGADEGEDAGRLSGVVGPEWQKVFWRVPASCAVLCGMHLLNS